MHITLYIRKLYSAESTEGQNDHTLQHQLRIKRQNDRRNRIYSGVALKASQNKCALSAHQNEQCELKGPFLPGKPG